IIHEQERDRNHALLLSRFFNKTIFFILVDDMNASIYFFVSVRKRMPNYYLCICFIRVQYPLDLESIININNIYPNKGEKMGGKRSGMKDGDIGYQIIYHRIWLKLDLDLKFGELTYICTTNDQQIVLITKIINQNKYSYMSTLYCCHKLLDGLCSHHINAVFYDLLSLTYFTRYLDLLTIKGTIGKNRRWTEARSEKGSLFRYMIVYGIDLALIIYIQITT
ncbi:hypothetical protein ACJX0J_040535, partial [Zea mays]